MQIKRLLDDQGDQGKARQIAANTKHGNETQAIREERSAKVAELYEPRYLVYEDHCPENGPALSITIISRSAVILFILPH